MCNLVYPACNGHAAYCHRWLTRLYNIFPHYLTNGTIFGKKVTEYKMCVLIFSTDFAWNISYSKKIWERYDQKLTEVFMWNTRYSCQILIKFQISRQSFEKYSNINFMKIRQVGAKMFHAGGPAGGRTERWTEKDDRVRRCFSQFCERAQKFESNLSS